MPTNIGNEEKPLHWKGKISSLLPVPFRERVAKDFATWCRSNYFQKREHWVGIGGAPIKAMVEILPTKLSSSGKVKLTFLV
jgi:hypothetical protein